MNADKKKKKRGDFRAERKRLISKHKNKKSEIKRDYKAFWIANS